MAVTPLGSPRCRIALLALVASSFGFGCALSPDDANKGNVDVTLIGNLPNSPFAQELGSHLTTQTVVEAATHPCTTPVLINADALSSLDSDTEQTIRNNYRAGRAIVLLNASQRHADALGDLVRHGQVPELFFYAEDGRRHAAVALELEPDGQVQYVLRGDSDGAFASDEVGLFLDWLDDDGVRIGQRLYERDLEPLHGPWTDISRVPDEAELRAHGEHEQTTHQFAGEDGALSITTTSVTAYSCEDSRYHSMVIAHIDGNWRGGQGREKALELIQLSRHIPGGELLVEPLVPTTDGATVRGFDLQLDTGAAFVLNDNRGTSVFAPVVTHLEQWTVQTTEVPMGDGEAGSHLWTVSKKSDDPNGFSYTTGWQWLFPLAASSKQSTVTAPIGARIGTDQREFTLTFKGPTTTLCE